MAERVAASMWQQQVAGTILAVFAVVAFVLAVVGVHAVTSYSVEMRKAEMGIRLALGADHAAVVRTMVAQSLAPVTAGLGAGIVVGWFAAGAITERLPVDAWSAGSAAVVLLVVATVAAALPAIRTVRRTDLPSVLR